MIYHLPAEFSGSPEQLQANYNSHLFIGERCDRCDCRPSGVASQWPCGADVPRITVVNGKVLQNLSIAELQDMWLETDSEVVIMAVQVEAARRADIREAAEQAHRVLVTVTGAA